MAARAELDPRELETLALWATGRLRPDVSVLLDRAPTAAVAPTAVASTAAVSGIAGEQHLRVQRLLTGMAAAQPHRYVVVDADGPPDEVAERVHAGVAPMLPARPTPQPPQPAPHSPAPHSPAPHSRAPRGRRPPRHDHRTWSVDALTGVTAVTVWDEVVGQPSAVAELSAAAENPAAMTHAWLFTGPPGSGRSVAARAFAAALECPFHGCGRCTSCHTVMSGTHADVREIVPEGLSISVKSMRTLVQSAARRPASGPYQVLIIQDADRLGERAANALLKFVEEPPAQTIFLLCAPSDHPEDLPVTIRSRCRPVPLHTPSPTAIADVLVRRDGVDPAQATWAASVAGGHVGRARGLARDPEARAYRETVLGLPLRVRGLGDVFSYAAALVANAKAEAVELSATRDLAEREELAVAMGAGGVGKGVAQAARGARAAEKELEKLQKSRNTRTQRDAIDRALVDLAGFYRDVLVVGSEAEVALTNPDHELDVRRAATDWTPESVLRRLESVLACRTALDQNVKPDIAVEAMMMTLQRG